VKKRPRLQRVWGNLLDLAAFWACAVIVLLEMIRLVFFPNSIDGIVLVLSIIVLLSMMN